MEYSQLKLANKAWWDERSIIHGESPFYKISELVSGSSALGDFEHEEFVIGDAESLLHLQCHIGTDTISWARRGVQVTGLDFSESALIQAQRIAESCGVEVSWVAADVYDAPLVLRDTYDIVYSGKGALPWLDDLDTWGKVVSKLLKPGGRLYLVEFHPISWILGDGEWAIVHDYFSSGQPHIESEVQGSYAASDAVTTFNTTAEWQHTLAEVISAVAGAGLVIEWFHEFPFTYFQQSPILEVNDEGVYEVPEQYARIPLMYSLCARKPFAHSSTRVM